MSLYLSAWLSYADGSYSTSSSDSVEWAPPKVSLLGAYVFLSQPSLSIAAR